MFPDIKGVGIKVNGYTLVVNLMHNTILCMRAVEALRKLARAADHSLIPKSHELVYI